MAGTGSAPQRRRRRAPVAGLVAATVLTAACGTRLDHDEIVAANGGAASYEQTVGATGADGLPAQTGGDAGSDAAAVTAPQSGGAATGAQAAPGRGGRNAARSTGGAKPAADSAAEAPAGAPIVIASVGNYSGIAGESQKDGPRALQIWAAWVNSRGGIKGHPVKVYVVDDGLDASRHQAALKDLVENKKVIAFVGNFAPFTISASTKYLEQKQVPVIGGDCAEYAWNSSPMLFNECASTQNSHYNTARVGALKGKGKRLGAIFCSEAEACKQAQGEWIDKGMARAAGLNPVYEDNISIGQPDFTAQCLNARNADVEIMTIVADINTVGRVVTSCERQNFRPQYLMSSGTMNARLAAMPAMDGALVKLATFPWTVTSNAAVKEFRDAYAKFGPKEGLTPVASQGWASAKIFEHVAQQVGAQPTTADILRGLWSVRNQTFGGLTVPLTYLQGKPSPKAKCAFWMQVKDGKMTAPAGLETVCRP